MQSLARKDQVILVSIVSNKVTIRLT
jgi:hypothetical protein